MEIHKLEWDVLLCIPPLGANYFLMVDPSVAAKSVVEVVLWDMEFYISFSMVLIIGKSQP